MGKNLEQAGTKALEVVENVGLLVIAIATVIAGGQEVMKMVEQREVRLEDLLLLFIYLEVLAMVAIYLESHKLPVRLPLYIAMVALARYLILDMKDMEFIRILEIAGAIFVLAGAVLLLRYGHARFPYTIVKRKRTESAAPRPADAEE